MSVFRQLALFSPYIQDCIQQPAPGKCCPTCDCGPVTPERCPPVKTCPFLSCPLKDQFTPYQKCCPECKYCIDQVIYPKSTSDNLNGSKNDFDDFSGVKIISIITNNGGTTTKNVLAIAEKLNARHLVARKIHSLENLVHNQVVRRNRMVQSGKIQETNANCAIVITEKQFVQNDAHRNNAKMDKSWAEVSFIWPSLTPSDFNGSFCSSSILFWTSAYGNCCPVCIDNPNTCLAYGRGHLMTVDGNVTNIENCIYTLMSNCQGWF